MHWKTAASALAISVALPTGSAGTTYGCWSDSGPKFHEDCVVAFTSLITQLSYFNNRDWVSVPNWIVNNYYGNCHASIKSTAGSSVLAEYLLHSFNQLGSRCQNGFYYYDNGWLDANIGGHAGWKRDEHGNETDTSDPDFPHGSIIQWEEPISPEAFPIPQEILAGLNGTTETKETKQNERQHARDLTARDNPIGTFITQWSVNGAIFNLYRSTGFLERDQMPVTYQIGNTFPNTVMDMLNNAVSNFGSGIIRSGLALTTGSTVDAIAIGAQLSGGYQSWQALFHSIGNGSPMMVGTLMVGALQDMRDIGWAGAVYHIYNQANNVIVSFILNGVTGRVTPLPSS